MAVPAKKVATYADLFDLPEHVVGEIIGGELVVSPRPAPRHAQASSRLGVELGGPFDRGRGGPGGWRILDEPELHFGADILVPDLAGWRRERLPTLPEEAFFRLAPDWVCEVASPGTALRDRRDKLPRYAQAQIDYLWLIDPVVRLLEVFRREGNAWLLLGGHGEAEVVRAEPFAAVELELQALWE